MTSLRHNTDFLPHHASENHDIHVISHQIRKWRTGCNIGGVMTSIKYTDMSYNESNGGGGS